MASRCRSKCSATIRQTGRVRLRLLAENIPATGYKLVAVGTHRTKLVIKPAEAEIEIQTRAVDRHADSLENEFIRLKVDPKTGCITSLFDKRSNTEALALPVQSEGSPAASPDGLPCGNLLQAFVDKPKRWDAWNVDADFVKQHWDLMQADEVKLVENTPLRAVIRVKHHFQKSSFVQDITMYPGVPRVDVHMQADWHEQHILLKVAFPVSARSDKATFEIPYGSVERPTTRNTPGRAGAVRGSGAALGRHLGADFRRGRRQGGSRLQPAERQQVRLRRQGQRAAPVVAALADMARSRNRPGTARVHLLALSAWRNMARGNDRASGLRAELSADAQSRPRSIPARCRRRSRSSRRRRTT